MFSGIRADKQVDGCEAALKTMLIACTINSYLINGGLVYREFNAERDWFVQDNSYYDFQIVLYPNGEINVNYNSLTGTHDATIGIQNASGTDGIQVSSGSGFADNNKSLLSL